MAAHHELGLLPDIDRSGLCLTNTSVFTHWLGTGDVCNGRGTCVNGLCVCDAGWTGRGDLFTLEGYACVVPVLLEEVLWYLVVASYTLAFLYALKVLRDLNHSSGGGSMRSWKLVFTATIALGCIPTVAWGFSRAYLHENIGVDAFPTAMVVLSMCPTQIVIGMDNLRSCSFLVSSNISNARLKDELLAKLQRREIFFSGLLITSVCSCMIAGTQLPKGPTVLRFALTTIKTLGTISWFGEVFAVNGLVLHELRKVKEALQQSGAKKDSKQDKRLTTVISSLESKMRDIQTGIKMFVPAYVLFILCPPLLVFEFVLGALVLSLTSTVMVGKYAKVKMDDDGAPGISSSSTNRHASKRIANVTHPAQDITSTQAVAVTAGATIKSETDDGENTAAASDIAAAPYPPKSPRAEVV